MVPSYFSIFRTGFNFYYTVGMRFKDDACYGALDAPDFVPAGSTITTNTDPDEYQLPPNSSNWTAVSVARLGW